MSTPAGEIGPQPSPLRPNLEALVKAFDRDAIRSKRLIRLFFDEDPPGFLSSAIPILRSALDTRGAQFVLSVLVENGLILPPLTDPAITVREATAIAKAARRVDSMMDVTLARMLADSAAADDATDVEQMTRLMEIVGSISDGARIFPSLVRLLRHPNPHIRSKAVLMIGRANLSAKWLRQRLDDTDPRIRGNAAEALWGVRTDEARTLLEVLLRDDNNRVAANAAVGLYRVGDCSTIAALVGMAGHESTLFRTSAAWAMGETADPRFTETLARLLCDPQTPVRRRAFVALGRIRAAAPAMQDEPGFRLAARLLPQNAGRTERRLSLGVFAENGGSPPDLLPTQILLMEDGQYIPQYRVADRGQAKPMPVLFLYPRGSGETVRACLPWRRPAELWAFVQYLKGEDGDPAEAENPPRFLSAMDAIESELSRTAPASACADLWRSIALAANTESGGYVGKRQLIVIGEPGLKSWAGPELIPQVIASQAFVQVVSAGPDPGLEEFCRKAHGVFYESRPDGVLQAYLNLGGQYEIVYEPLKPDARTLRMRVRAPGISAGTEVDLTASGPRDSAPEGSSTRVPGPTGS